MKHMITPEQIQSIDDKAQVVYTGMLRTARYAGGHFGGEIDEEDIVQTAWLGHLNDLEKDAGEGIPTHTQAYINRRVIWAARNQQRRDRNRPQSGSDVRELEDEPCLDSREASVEDIVIVHELQNQVDFVLMSLPEGYRDALIMAYALDMKREQIGESLGISNGAARTKLLRAREAFAKLWEDIA